MKCGQIAEIIRKKERSIEVIPVAHALCDACVQHGRCRADWLSGVVGRKKNFEIPLDAPISAEVGDRVTLVTDSTGILWASVGVYGFPLAGLLLGVGLGTRWDLSDLWSLILASIGTGVGWVGSRLFKQAISVRVKQ